MHEKIQVRVDLSYPDEYNPLFEKNILTKKNITGPQVEAAIMEWLANTNFSSDHQIYDFEYDGCTTSIGEWLAECKKEHSDLTIEEPASDEELTIGTFKSDHKYAGYATVLLVYERRYLENE